MAASQNISVGTLDGSGSSLTTRVRLAGRAVGRDGARGNLVGFTPSPNYTVVTTVGSITNSVGEVWAITALAQIAVNGVPDPVTSNVVELAYVNAVLWQLNTSGDWYSKPRASAAWSAATKISPLPSTAVLVGSGSGLDKALGALSAIATPGHPFSKDFDPEFQT